MRKFLLGMLTGATLIGYLNWGVPDYMFAAGNLSGVQDAYDFTCGKAARGGHNDKFWEAALEAYKKKAEREQSPPSEAELKESAARLNENGPWTTVEFLAINQNVLSCAYLRDDSLDAAKRSLAEANEKMRGYNWRGHAGAPE